MYHLLIPAGAAYTLFFTNDFIFIFHLFCRIFSDPESPDSVLGWCTLIIDIKWKLNWEIPAPKNDMIQLTREWSVYWSLQMTSKSQITPSHHLLKLRQMFSLLKLRFCQSGNMLLCVLSLLNLSIFCFIFEFIMMNVWMLFPCNWCCFCFFFYDS